MDPVTFIDELNATTLKRIHPAKVRDFYFRNSALLARIRANGGIVPWQGGLYEQNPFAYAPLIGGPYAQGTTFNTAKVETTSGNLFYPREYYVNITEFLRDLYVVNKGPAAVISRVGLDNKIAINTLNEIVAIAGWRHGQSNSGGNPADNRTTHMNGLSEAINDGVSPSWDGNVFPAYGGVNRLATGPFSSGDSVLRSVPRWCGDSSGNPGKLTYLQMMLGYQECSLGGQEPDLGIANKGVFAHILNSIQPQQRIMQNTVDYIWGVSGVSFMKAVIVKDDYCPSAAFGKSKPTGDYTTSAFTTPSSGIDANSGLPSNTSVTPAGTFWWLNTKTIRATMPDGLYGMGFTGFQRPYNADVIAGQILLSYTMMCDDPRLNKQYYGITESY